MGVGIGIGIGMGICTGVGIGVCRCTGRGMGIGVGGCGGGSCGMRRCLRGCGCVAWSSDVCSPSSWSSTTPESSREDSRLLLWSLSWRPAALRAPRPVIIQIYDFYYVLSLILSKTNRKQETL